ncbi:MAG: response regulator [Vicinamibacteria bacterium]|nr:response regulator [Vicinamibacteria bacterium]
MLRVVVPYLLLAGLWIIVSDRLLLAWLRDPEQLAAWSTYKGWAFVVVTGALLAILLAAEYRARAVDSSALRLVEDALRASEQSYRLLFRANPHPMWIYDTETLRFLEVNDAAVSRYGWSRDEFASMSVLDIREPEQVERFREHLATVPAAVHGSGPWRHVTKAGELRDVEVSSHAVEWLGRPARLVLAHDVTERDRAERERLALQSQLAQAQKLESIGRLAGGIAHDFNNALGVVLARAEMARKALAPGHEAARHLDSIEEAGRRSARLTRQLLAFARHDVIAPQRLDLDAHVAASFALLKPLIGEDVALRWEPGPGLKVVEADGSQLDQVLTNLVVNARDAGGRVLQIATACVVWREADCARRPGAVPGTYVRLSVTDDGAGMSPEVQARVFDPFFTTKPAGQGTGLGLAMVYGIVKQNGGYVEVDSAPGRGARFDILLPAREPLPEPCAEKDPGPAAQPAHGEVVLLVEDEEAMLAVTSEALDEFGYRVLAAAGPAQALSIAAAFEGAIDLVITDVVMPGMNGRELVDRLRETRPGLRYLFVSGYTADVIEHRGVLEPGVHFLAKPFTAAGLDARVRAVLAR